VSDNSSSPTAAASTTSPTTSVIQVWNKAAAGQFVTTVRAMDADSGANARLDYIILGGNSDGLLRVDRTSGVLTIARDLRGDIDNTVKKIVLCECI
jgi:Cadherin domain